MQGNEVVYLYPSTQQTSPEKTARLVKLPQYLQPHTIESKRNKGNFASLLKLLRDIYLKATSEEVR